MTDLEKQLTKKIVKMWAFKFFLLTFTGQLASRLEKRSR